MGRGAVISILDVTTLTPVTEMVPIQEVEVPEVGPQALAYFRHPAPDPGSMEQQRWLFLAGGSLGLWRITLCEDLFLPTPLACSDSTFQRTEIDRPGSSSTWQWKRCVDVAIVEGNAAAGQPLLFALYAANSDPLKSTVGPTEVRCYKLEPDGTTSLFAAVDLPSDGPGGLDAVGMALDSDPADPNNVYVALGTAWLWKVTIQTNPTLALVPSQVPTPGTIALCSLATCPDGEAMTDIDFVHVPLAGPVVYAALEYGRVLEYRITTGLVKELTLTCPPATTGQAYLDRISAVTAGASSVLISAACQSGATRFVQTRAPFMADGIWSDICITPGFGGANVTPNSSCAEIQLLWGRPTSACAPSVLPLERVEFLPLWGSLQLTHQGGFDFRLYASSGEGATAVFELFEVPCGEGAMGPTLPPLCPIPCLEVELLATWIGPTFAPADGAMSIVNPALTFHGQDGWPPYQYAGELQILGSPPAIDFFPVGNLSSCPGTMPPPPVDCGTFKVGSRSPFGGSAAGSATWRDPVDPELEWFTPGGLTSVPMQVTTVPVLDCSEVDLCSVADACAADPTQLVRWRTKALLAGQEPVGWSLARMHPTPPPGQNIDGTNLMMSWWQFSSPTEPAIARSDSVPYVFSAADPRLVDPILNPAPLFLHLVRGGTDFGYKLMSPTDLMTRAQGTCSPGMRGRGENLAPIAQIPFAQARTHVEFEDPGTLPGEDRCNIIVACAGNSANFARNQHNNKMHVFSVLDPGGEEVWIAAVAAGFVASGPSQPIPLFDQVPSCQWTNDYGRALITFYDVTDVELAPGGGDRRPHLIRVALGPPSSGPTGVQSHAFAIRTKSTGSDPWSPVYAYVADLTGRLLTYDVSWSALFIACTARPDGPLPAHQRHSPPLLEPDRNHRVSDQPLRRAPSELRGHRDRWRGCLLRPGPRRDRNRRPVQPRVTHAAHDPGHSWSRARDRVPPGRSERRADGSGGRACWDAPLRPTCWGWIHG